MWWKCCCSPRHAFALISPWLLVKYMNKPKTGCNPPVTAPFFSNANMCWQARESRWQTEHQCSHACYVAPSSMPQWSWCERNTVAVCLGFLCEPFGLPKLHCSDLLLACGALWFGLLSLLGWGVHVFVAGSLCFWARRLNHTTPASVMQWLELQCGTGGIYGWTIHMLFPWGLFLNNNNNNPDTFQ